MTDISIDTALNAHLGLPDGYKLDKVEAFKLYQFFHSMHPVDRPIDQYFICYYVDKRGDFVNNPKSKQDYAVKAIHDNMDRSDQFQTLKYISEHLEEISD